MQMTQKQKLQKELQDNQKIEACATMFGVAGDKTRLKICYLLCHHPELSVSQMAELIDAPISTVSHSLQKLKEVGVVANRKEAKTVYYSLKKTGFTKTLKGFIT
jgi:ArsR family transcriptional regulator